MADEFAQYKRGTDEFSSYKRQKKEEPGWFQPGSKSEAAVRGFSQGATFGFGDEIQAGIRSLLGNEKYKDLRNQERTRNEDAAATNPGSYIAGNIVAALPQAANVAGVARSAGKVLGSKALGGAASGAGTGGVYGAIQGAGQAKEIKDIPAEVVKQGALGAAGGAVQGGLVGRAGVSRPKFEDRGYWTPKTGAEYAKRAADATAKAGGQSLIQQLPQSLLGGYAGINKALNSDWSDPYSAGLDVAKDAALGYGAGYVMGKVPSAVEVGKDVLKSWPGNTSRVVGHAMVDAAETNTGSALSTAPFRFLTDYIKQAQGTTNPDVEQVAQQAQDAVENSDDPNAKRKAAMVLQGTPAGRAVGNSSSNVRDLD